MKVNKFLPWLLKSVELLSMALTAHGEKICLGDPRTSVALSVCVTSSVSTKIKI